MTTIRSLVDVYTKQSWPHFQLDVNNAFLHGDLDEDIYMLPPMRSIISKPLDSSFKIKDLGKLNYLLGMEVLYTTKGVIMWQRKFAKDMLSEFDTSNLSITNSQLPHHLQLKAHEGLAIPEPFTI
ncbi:uncharacterized protein LOC143559552 [Bidens hawaiensis]|uniref:uncharacterized protein LOC143559552 n=1 Tax=Bidens hawaiensis TaxID=980011 RepID=UPI0040494E82